MLYLLGRSQKWVMMVAPMTCEKTQRSSSVRIQLPPSVSESRQSLRSPRIRRPLLGDNGWTTLGKKTHHDELNGDRQRQLLSVAAVKFFDHDEHKEGQNADDKLWHFGLRQQAANIHHGLWERGRWREVGVSMRDWVRWLIEMIPYQAISTFLQPTGFRVELIL